MPVAFDVDDLTGAAFLGTAALWLVMTTIAYIHIRARRLRWDRCLAARPLPLGTALAAVLG